MNHKSKYSLSSVVFAGITFLAIVLLKYIILDFCSRTNSPFGVLVDLSTEGIFFAFVIIILYLFLNWSTPETPLLDNLAGSFQNPLLKIALLIGAVVLIGSQFLPLSGKWGGVKVNDKTPARGYYSLCLLLDTVEGDTETVTLWPRKVKVDAYKYTSSYRGHSTKHTEPYISFHGFGSYLYRPGISYYLSACEKNSQQIQVEYYRNSGLIRTVDGVSLYDTDRLKQLGSAIVPKETEQPEDSQAEQQAEQQMKETDVPDYKTLKEELERQQLNAFKVFFKSEGKNYESLLSQLRENSIPNPYSTIYISTQYYGIGEVALFDNINGSIYVVRDNDSEDMVCVPPIPQHSTLSEISKILDDAGIKWLYNCSGYHGNQAEADHSKDVLNTYYRPPGTPIPKDYVYWFSVKHVN